MTPILATVAGKPENEDRGLVISDGPRTILCVADGAGGLSGAAEAATAATEFHAWNSPDIAAQELFDLVKLPEDKYPDDVTVIVGNFERSGI